MSASQKTSFAVGILGTAAGAIHAFWCWRIVSAPNAGPNENGFAVLFLGCAILSLLPAAGLFFALLERAGTRVLWKIWLALALPAGLLTAALAAVLTVIFLTN